MKKPESNLVRCGSLVYALSYLLLAHTVLAADPGSAAAPPEANQEVSALDEIIITSARQRNETVQETPVAVTVMTEHDLDVFHASTLNDMNGVTPNVHISTTGFSQDAAEIYMRGFGVTTGEPSTDPAVAIYVDGIYMPTVTGSLMDAFDLERVEVLRGPQGTLLGKNSTAGAISVRTARPSGDLDASLKVDLASYDRVEARGRVDVPIVKDVLSAKLSLLVKEGGDYIRDLTVPGVSLGGDDIRTGRLGLLFTPNDKLNWYVTGDYTLNRSPQHGGRDITTGGVQPPFTPTFTYACGLYGYCDPSRNPMFTTRANDTQGADIRNYGVVSDLSYNFGAASLTSVTGYRRYIGVIDEDVDSEPQIIFEAHNDRVQYNEVTQEVRLSPNKGQGWDWGGRLDWVAGLYGFYEKYEADYHFLALDIVAPGGIPVNQYQQGKTSSGAAFGHVIYNLTDQWNVSVGARDTHDMKEHAFQTDGNAYQSADWNNVSWEAGTQFKFNDRQMVYARLATGYRGGGFDPTPDVPADAHEYQPEKVRYGELGLKADWFDKRLRTNFDVFYAKYKDLQKSGDVPAHNPQGFQQVTVNAASATSKGVELELTAVPIPQLTLRENVGYLDNRYHSYFGDPLGTGTNVDLSNTPFQDSPKWTSYSSAGYEYTLPRFGTKAAANVGYSYHTEEFTFTLPSIKALQPAIGLLDASLDFDLDQNSNVQVSVYGKNLTDKHYIDYTALISVGFFALDALPRTYGGSIRVKF